MQANPHECTTPEAWAELVRTERASAQQMAAEMQFLRQANTGLVAEIERLMALLAGHASKDEA